MKNKQTETIEGIENQPHSDEVNKIYSAENAGVEYDETVLDENDLLIKENIEKYITVPLLSEAQKNVIINRVSYVVSEISDEQRSKLYQPDGNRDPWLVAFINSSDGSVKARSNEKLRDYLEDFLMDDYPEVTLIEREANCYYSATLMAKINELYETFDESIYKKKSSLIYNRYLGRSDSIVSSVGGLSNQLNLLSLADSGYGSRSLFSTAILGDITYNFSFSGNDETFVEPFENKDTLQKLYLLNTECRIAKYALRQGEYANKIYYKIEKAVSKLSLSNEEPFLLKAVAKGFLREVNSNYSFANHPENWVEGSPWQIEQEEMNDYYERVSQESLHKKFPMFGEKDHLVMVAQGVCGSRTFLGLDKICDQDGKSASVLNWKQGNNFNISQDDAFLLRLAHQEMTRRILQENLSLNIDELSISSQVRFLKFAIESSNDRYNKLASAIHKYKKPDDKMKFFESFLSLDFGEDFGDTILSIAEHAEQDKSLEIFKIVGQYRETSKNFGELYKDFDPSFALAAEQAMNERLTDLLVLAESVAENGGVTVDVSPGKNKEGYISDGHFNTTVKSLDEVIDVMKSVVDAQQILKGILSDDKTQLIKSIKENGDMLQFQSYQFMNQEKGFAKLHVREQGSTSYDKSAEYGNSSGTEATIGWLVNPKNPYNRISAKDPDAISFRFDREGRLATEPPDSSNRSPIRKEGIISLDIGSVLGNDPNSLPTRLGRMIAAGNEIRASRLGVGSSLNHNINYFDQKYGNADEFENLVKYIKNKVENNYKKPAKGKLSELAINLEEKSRKRNAAA